MVHLAGRQNRLYLRRLLPARRQESHLLAPRALLPRLAIKGPQRPQRHVVAFRWHLLRLPRRLRGITCRPDLIRWVAWAAVLRCPRGAAEHGHASTPAHAT